MLPEGDWKASNSEVIAARLVNRLPGRSAASTRWVAAGRGASEKTKSGFATWFATGLAWGVLAVALFSLGLHLFSDNNLDAGGGTGVATQQ